MATRRSKGRLWANVLEGGYLATEILKAHGFPEPSISFLGHSLRHGHRRNAPGLRGHDAAMRGPLEAILQNELRHLGQACPKYPPVFNK